MAPRTTPLAVEIPTAADDRPAWTKVGIVAALGFVIGIAWPKLTQTRIAPSPPNDGRASSTQAAPTSAGATDKPSSASAASSDVAAAATSPREQTVAVGAGTIAKCRDAKRAMDGCGALAVDPLLVPRIEQLAKCPAANGVEGKLSIGFDIDFGKKTIRVLQGATTTLPRAAAEGVMKCASPLFAEVKLDGVAHDHRRYRLFYAATFQPAGKGATAAKGSTSENREAAATPSEAKGLGTATVVWDRVIVRDVPKSQTIAGRVVRGEKVKLLAKDGNWYRIRYGTDVNHEGWVYRAALGP